MSLGRADANKFLKQLLLNIGLGNMYTAIDDFKRAASAVRMCPCQVGIPNGLQCRARLFLVLARIQSQNLIKSKTVAIIPTAILTGTIQSPVGAEDRACAPAVTDVRRYGISWMRFPFACKGRGIEEP